MEDMLINLLVMAVLIEATIETGKILVEQPSWEHFVSFLGGGVLAFLFKVPFLRYLPINVSFTGLTSQLVSAFFVGVLMLRYSGKINDLLEWINYLKSLGKPTTA